MLHHLSLPVSHLSHSAAFYDAALGALGFRRVFEDATAIGYGLLDGEDKLCLKLRQPATAAGPGFHLAFAAPSRAAVDRFHAAALAVGGRDNGAPGLRPEYGPHYYAAFLIDPDGHRIEAVINAPAPAEAQSLPDSPSSSAPEARFLHYLRCYAAKDLEGIAGLLAEEVSLRDWNMAVRGRAAVLAATRQNFEAAERIEIWPLRVHAAGHSVAGELRILVDGRSELFVVDVLDFDAAGRIKAIRAYLGRGDD